MRARAFAAEAALTYSWKPRSVSPSGLAYDLAMTDAMLELAERNRTEVRVENVRFLRGIIEDIPLPPESVAVAISNCVINLLADKDQVLAPRGWFAVSEVIY